MGHFSKNLGPLADEVVTECEFVSLDQKRRVKAVTTSGWMGNSSVIESHFNAFLLAFRAELALFMQ